MNGKKKKKNDMILLLDDHSVTVPSRIYSGG